MINNYSSAEKAREKEREKDKNNTIDIETNTPNKPLEKSEKTTEKSIEKSTATLIIPPAPCHLTIAEIMLVVADLVSVVQIGRAHV